jgi:predicted PurR-regulated permease PerM
MTEDDPEGARPQAGPGAGDPSDGGVADGGQDRLQNVHPIRVVSLEGTPWRWIFLVLLMALGVQVAGSFVIGLVVRLQALILWLVTSLFLSFALEPAVSWLAGRGWRRGLATFLILLGIAAGVIALVVLMVPVFVEQLSRLFDALPGIVDKLGDWTDRTLGFQISAGSIQDSLRNASTDLTSFAKNVAGNLLGVGGAILGGIFQVLTISLFTFYLVAEGPRFRRTVLGVLPPRYQERVLWTWEVAIDKTGGYLYSRLLLAIFNGLATFVALRILGVDFALPLSVWEGLVSQFIPTIGTYIAMALPLLVAVVGDPVDALVLLIFFTGYQQIENYILSPRITAHTMKIHPALAFGAAVAGATLGGVVGAFLAIPAAAIIQAVISTLVERHEVVDSDLTREPDEPGGPAKPSRVATLMRNALARRRSGTPEP